MPPGATRAVLGKPRKIIKVQPHVNNWTYPLCPPFDLSLAPASGGTCQVDVLVMWHALRGSEYSLDIDIDKVRQAEEVFKDCMSDYFLPPEATTVEPLIPWSPMPGGALTANTQMMRDNGLMDKYPDLIKAMSDVVRRGGFGTSVTPVSQFYVQQAMNNVMFGPWEKIAPPYGKMVLGYFGKTPVPPDPEIVKLASEQLKLEPTTAPPLELNDADPKKGIPAARKMLEAEGLETTDENIFIAATCMDKGIKFLKGEGEIGVRKIDKQQPAAPGAQPQAGGPTKYIVSVSGRNYSLTIDGNQATVDGKTFNVALSSDSSAIAAHPSAPPASAKPIKAQMPGVVLKIPANVGDAVQAGDPLIVVEAMKMEVAVAAPRAGIVASIEVAVGDHVATGQTLATIE